MDFSSFPKGCFFTAADELPDQPKKKRQSTQTKGGSKRRRRTQAQPSSPSGDQEFESDQDDEYDHDDNNNNNNNNNDDDDDDKQQQHIGTNVVCCSIHYDKSVLGMASYDDAASTLRVCWTEIEKTSPSRDAKLTRAISLYIEEIGPSFIVLSSQSERFIHDACRLSMDAKGGHDLNAFVPEDEVAVTSNNEFNVIKANRTILEFCGQGRNNQAANAALRACGGLIQYLIKHQVLIPPTNGAEPPLRFEITTTADHVLIDHMSLSALGIFAVDRHPNVQGSQRSKEGFSLSALLCSYCRTSAAKKLMRQWLRRPTNDRATLHYRYDTIDTFLSTAAHRELVNHMLAEIKSIKMIHASLRRLRKYTIASMDLHQLRDWKQIWEFCRQSTNLRGFATTILNKARTQGHTNNSFHRVAGIPDGVDAVLSVIERTLDFRLSQDHDRAFPRRGLDANLDNWRQIEDGLGSFLEEVAGDVAEFDIHYPSPEDLLNQNINSDILQHIDFEVSVAYKPQIGYTTVICNVRESQVEFVKTQLDGLLYVFTELVEVDTYECHFKSERMQEMDNTIGDVTCAITDVEAEILISLRDEIFKHVDDLLVASEAISEFDALAAFAHIAEEKRYTRPTLQSIESNTIRLIDGKHPLQEFTLDTFIPNSVTMGPNASIILITGPNGSGKSILLKSVGMLIVMALAGGFVPASELSIGKIDSIFTRITNQESITTGESAFTIDLLQMKNAVDNCTKHSLVLVDEFGKGTETRDGASLLAASLFEFDRIQPNVILTTHMWELFEHGVLAGCNNIRTYHMEVTTDDTDDDAGAGGGAADGGDSKNKKSITMKRPSYARKVVPKFVLAPGRATSSMALSCAHASGFPSEILERAAQIMDCFISGKEIPPIDDISAYVGSGLADLYHRKDQAKKLLEKYVLSMVEANEDQQEWKDDSVLDLLEKIQNFNDISLLVEEVS